MRTQLTFTFTGTLQTPVADPLRAEYLTLLNTPMRCLHDLQQQLTSVRMRRYMLRKPAEKELTAWKMNGLLGYDPDDPTRDARQIALNEEIIRLEHIADSLQEQIDERLRLEYLKSLM